jgi:N-acyl-D-aspartate/D-glutamate deacylase
MFDFLIKDTWVLDGTGIPRFKANVAIKGDKIDVLSKTPIKDEARTVIDGSGLALSPGFVDMHTHADVAMMTDPYASNLIRQGITLAITGNCGSSPAPINSENKRIWEKRVGNKKVDVQWNNFSEYLANVEKYKFSINIASLVGHNAIRMCAMGQYTKKSVPNSSEMVQMKEMVEEAMQAGAIGMSTGLMYIPGIYSETPELIELSKIVSKYGGVYFSHMRGEANELLQSVTEVIKIAEEAKVSAEISHHRTECKVNWGLIRHTIQMMEDANRRGSNVTCDFFPYQACGVGGGIPLPQWANPLYMPKEEAIKIIKDPKQREKIKEQIRLGTKLGPEARSYEPIDSLDEVVITIYPDHPELQGKTVTELAKINGYEDPYEFFLDTVTSDQTFGVVSFDVWEEDLRTLVRSPLAMIGTDAGFIDDDEVPNRHPRNYGSCPKILGKYVREEKLISWEEAVMKLSSRPHSKLGFHDRGIIRPGFYADLVLFNPNTIIDKETYSGKVVYPEGIEYVFVNGKLVVSKNKHTKAVPGKLLRNKH